ncbi:hypothetical protein TorRG33x02_348350 [Trema orientale]|uniref:Uncharacterized protein n=1 Tax=Trema orientale TaxID=63057 RepID=A0A2P5AK52_TREOI|nr:hypothetical protein TorRG33x02_348350 [Trema orientale]
MGSDGQFRRFYRGSNYQQILECSSNKAGMFMKIMKIQNGMVRSIIVRLREHSRDGRILVAKQYGGEDNRRNERSSKVRNWRLAVVVFRDNVEIQWNVINTGLRRNVVLTKLFADRAILWCMNEDEKKIVLKFQTCFLFNTRPIRVVSWSQEYHWANVKFAGRDTWIGVNGLSLDWWKENIFRRIGEKLGGLIGKYRGVPGASDSEFFRSLKTLFRIHMQRDYHLQRSVGKGEERADNRTKQWSIHNGRSGGECSANLQGVMWLPAHLLLTPPWGKVILGIMTSIDTLQKEGTMRIF